MSMSTDELDQAILGGQLREARQMKLSRLLTYCVLKYLGYLDKKISITDFFPMLFDAKSKSKGRVKDSKEWKAMMERFRKRDLKRGRIKE